MTAYQKIRLFVACVVMTILSQLPARAEETLKIAIGQHGVFENSISEIGQQQGFFKKNGLNLEILYTQGGGETQQAVIGGAVDIGVGVGTLGVLSAFSKGAPVRVIGATMKGAYEYWFVPTDSPIKSFKDANGKSVAFSTVGSSTQLMVLSLAKLNGVDVKSVATGSPTATLTQTMSKQVDVGFALSPIGIEQLLRNEIRIIARGSDVPDFAKQTVRFLIVNASALEKNPVAFKNYMKGYRETLDWLYADPTAVKAYAAWAKVPEEVARRTRDEFIPKANANPDVVSGLDLAMRDAVELKFLRAPLSEEQVKTLIQVPFK